MKHTTLRSSSATYKLPNGDTNQMMFFSPRSTQPLQKTCDKYHYTTILPKKQKHYPRSNHRYKRNFQIETKHDMIQHIITTKNLYSYHRWIIKFADQRLLYRAARAQAYSSPENHEYTSIYTTLIRQPPHKYKEIRRIAYRYKIIATYRQYVANAKNHT